MLAPRRAPSSGTPTSRCRSATAGRRRADDRRDAPTHGEAKNSWLTGSAAWNFVAITQWILGIRPEHGGLRIDPVVPAAWPGFSVTRRFRGATYAIKVRKLAGSAGRVTRLVVDGTSLEGNLLSAAPAGSTVDVEAFVDVEP